MTTGKRKAALISIFALAALSSIVSTAALGVVIHRVRRFDAENKCSVLALRPPLPAPAEAAKAVKPPLPAPEAATNSVVKVRGIEFCENAIRVDFSGKPKAEDALGHISISPKVEAVTVEVETEKLYWQNEIHHYVYLRSENFKYRTPYSVTVKRDIPLEGGCWLEEEVTRVVVRPDIPPAVSLADGGRYLPPVGDRTIAVKSVNVSRLACTVRYVLPENIVQLLARDERQYRKSLGWWAAEADSDATTEISTVPTCWEEEAPDKLNEWSRYPISLRYENGVVSNGVYLLSVRNADRQEDYSNRPEYRLVCMTDLALSVRRGKDDLRVWVTSLTTGKPVSGAVAKLYASNRLLLASSKTDALGEVVLEGWDGRYDPFALVVSREDGSDASFMAIRDSMKIDESLPSGARPEYKAPDECRAFVWTDRGIYRHGEKIMVHAILRNGRGDAPRPFPVTVKLEDPSEREAFSASAVSDEYGAIKLDSFYAPDAFPSGKWKIKVFTPGKGGALLGERLVKIEEFVPPQIKVSLKDFPVAFSDFSNVSYRVKAEHLFGGAAKRLTAESLVSFSDAPFEPEGWKGFRFGDFRKGLRPNYTKLPPRFTDDCGQAQFTVGMEEAWGDPQAAVRVTVQGSVFETGGRPSVTRESRVLHRYAYYIGSNIPRYINEKPGFAAFKIVQVEPSGKPHRKARRLKAELWKIEHVFNLVRDRNGTDSWDCERIRKTIDIANSVEIGEDGEGTVELPVSGSGEYEFAVEDEESGLSHAVSFWISSGGDDEVRANLKNPTAVEITADKKLYREGEAPRLTIKAPFKGTAWIAVMREKTLYTRVLEITNLTSVVELDPLDGAWAPNVDVAISLVQSLEAGKNHLAARAHGILPLGIRTRASDLPVKLEASVKCKDSGGSEIEVEVVSRGEAADGERAVVTVVDEGINILTAEPVPDPIGFFSVLHGAWHPLYDLYGRLLPVYDSSLKASGVKTGGDDLAGMMNRVSPVPTRRFKPLSLWQFDIPLTNGAGIAKFALPEFVGEVRITAVAYSKRGTGCNAIRKKVSPKLVMQPDAPRFAAPGDRFQLTLSLSNRSGKDSEVEYELASEGAVKLIGEVAGRASVKDGDSLTLTFPAEAGNRIGQGVITYRAKGCAETHTAAIELPVRPAVAWEETAEVKVLYPGEAMVSSNAASSLCLPELTHRTFALAASPVAELLAAFDYLAEYPHGCLEQTTSRMFPLIYGGALLGRLAPARSGNAPGAKDVVDSGIARVVSMLRQNDFTMWPDVNCPPWDREVSLYAAHFLVEAEAAGFALDKPASERVKELLKKWAFDPDTNISVYACHSLALAGRPEKDRMFSLYDSRANLPLLSRTRLARAFARIGDPKRARELVADASLMPSSVKEAAFALVTLLELDSGDRRIPALVLYLQKNRDRRRFHWGTTGDNAHALMALGAYYRAAGTGGGAPALSIGSGAGGKETRLEDGASMKIEGGGDVMLRNCGTGDAFVSVKTLSLPCANAVTNEHNLIDVSRRFVTSEGFDVDLAHLVRGELLIGEITLSADRDAEFSDLVVQDLFPACFEPERREVADAYARWHGGGSTTEWVLRSDIRDDRAIVFSKPVKLARGASRKVEAKFFYAVRVVTPGDFVLPGVRVEAMYAPEIKAKAAPSRIRIEP